MEAHQLQLRIDCLSSLHPCSTYGDRTEKRASIKPSTYPSIHVYMYTLVPTIFIYVVLTSRG
jgi:hypothetical protein